MPLIGAGGIRQYYRLEGNEEIPVLMFAHSLGCDHSQWDPQAAEFAARFRVLRYDIRGHGATEAPPGDYTAEMLGRDALALADALGIRQFAFCGLSLGGVVGQWLAANAPERLTAVVLANTSPKFSDPDAMETRRRTVLEKGMAAVADTVMQRFFTEERLIQKPPIVANIRRVVLATNPVGYAGCCAAIRDVDQVAILGRIRTPTLIISGARDVSTPWEGNGEVLAREIAHAKVEHLPTAHLSNANLPRSFNAALWRFLLPEPYDALAFGSGKRRQMLGDAHVNRAIEATTDFTRAFQELITR